MLKLIVGNKNYSSWSMRAWVLLKQAEIPFEEVMLRFDAFDASSAFKKAICQLTPTGKVPLLLDDDLAIWDTLAIAEYLAEQFPDKHLWPQDRAARARARSVCAEMHAGFSGLRSDVARLMSMWQSLLAEHGGPLLFGNFTIADAYFAPICTRLKTYALPLTPTIAAYVERVLALPGVQAWIDGALTEQDFLPFEEPYRLRR